MSIIQIAHNATTAKLIEATKEQKLEVQRILSYQVAGCEHMHAFKSGSWDGRSTFFDYSSATFPRGFVMYVNQVLSKDGHKVQVVKKPLPQPLGPENPKVDSFKEDPRYDYQIEVVRRLEKHGQIIAQVATGGGKCLGRDTPVLMFDGTIKKVQDVVAGDLLMGPDSMPRTVLSTCVGRGSLYRVVPTKGDPYVVNDAHILSLKKTCRGNRGRDRKGPKYPKGEVVNINVEDYLRETDTFRHIHKGWRTGVEFEVNEPLRVDPYLLGIILGDGTINGAVSVTTADDEVVQMLQHQANHWGLSLTACEKGDNAASTYYLSTGRTGGNVNPLMMELRAMGFSRQEGNKSCEKFIPHDYKTASRHDRLELLAGILDSDGHYDGKGLYLTLKNERLFDDVLFVVRSLGFAAYKRRVSKRCHNNGVVGTYFSMCISGALETIPVRLPRRKANPRVQKKDPLVTGLSVEPVGEGDYFGFELDGDHLFMLGDFTVTHNTRVAKLCVARINRPTLFLTTRGVLMYQMATSFESLGKKVAILGDGNIQVSKEITCGMVQTIVSWLKEPDEKDTSPSATKQRLRREKMINALSAFEFVILEEAHEASGNSYYEILRHCKNANYRLALTATPFMKDDEESNMRLMASSGHVAIKVTEETLINRGILAKPYFKYVELKEAPPKLFRSTNWQRAYELGIMKNDLRNKHIVAEAMRAKSYGLSTMILVQRKDHGSLLCDKLNSVGVRSTYIFGEDNQDERSAAISALKDKKIDVLIGTTILDVGVDVPAVGMVILAGGGKAEVALRQRIGRGLREKRDGSPNVALIVDFADSHNIHLKGHYLQRRSIVEGTKGFAENIVKDFDYPSLGLKKV